MSCLIKALKLTGRRRFAMRAVASCFRNAAKLSILVTDRNHPERTSGLGIISAGYTGNAGRNNIGAAPLAARSAKLQRSHPLNRKTRMAAPEEINADMLAFWNGKGGHTWVARQEHTGDGCLARLCCTTRRRAGGGYRLRLRRAHAGVCARRRSVRPRGGIRHFRADAG